MRLLKESLLSFFVLGIVLCLYLLAGGVALFSLCGFVSQRGEPEAVRHFKIVTDATSRKQIHITGELQ